MICPECGNELELEDTFGNRDYCLNAIGYTSDFYTKRHPIKGGDIYWCETCKENYHTLEESNELFYGYPC